jgi:hypothetical protein
MSTCIRWVACRLVRKFRQRRVFLSPCRLLALMSFLYYLGMFRPTQLVCSIQGTFNPVHDVRSKDIEAIHRIPKSLKNELRKKKCILRTYELSISFVTRFPVQEHDKIAYTPFSFVAW